MFIRRKIGKSLVEYIENTTEAAEEFGASFIEVRHTKNGAYTYNVMGVNSVSVRTGRVAGSRTVQTTGYDVIQDGTLTFYPDAKQVRWAWILDTPDNRDWLAQQFQSPTAAIADKSIEKEILELAKEKGYRTDKVAVADALSKYIRKDEAKAEEFKIKDENEELKAKLAALEAELKKATKAKVSDKGKSQLKNKE